MKSLLFNTALLCLPGVVLYYAKSKNNVCKTFSDYYSNRDGNENCYYNPEFGLSTPEIIKRRGYQVEIHEVVTNDGYILTLFRIPSTGKPVFLQHGYAANSRIFVMTGNKSLAFILADQGYDVWLGNSRGTIYSQNHTSLGISEEEYWDFSFDELGIYDLPAAINYIGNKTKQKITYIGLSMGTLIMHIYALTYPQEAYDRVDMFVNLAPSVFIKDYGATLNFAISNWEYIEPILQAVAKTKSVWSTIFSPIVKFACFPFPFQMRACMLPLMLMFGFNYGQHDPESLPMILMQPLESASIKMFTHGVQLAQSGTLTHFNNGAAANLEIYGTHQPPVYNFTKMKVPIYTFRAQNDQVITKINVDALYEALPKEVTSHGIYVVDNDEFSHTDFVFGKDVVELVYNHLINFLRALQS